MEEATTIPTTKEIKERLKNYGRKGETYSDILTRLMDSVSREELMDLMHRRLEEKEQFVSLDDVLFRFPCYQQSSQ
jgi:predicted CopG family antitoxin